MQERRVVLVLGVTYDTSADQLESIPGMIKTIIEGQDKVRFDRAHFRGFGDSALEIEVVYWVLSADYTEFMNCQQAINFAIFRAFEGEGIEFAFPSQTLYVPGLKNAIEAMGDEAGKAAPAKG
jgi:small-conductance mechanosensitive channel